MAGYDLESIRAELISPDCGYYLIRGFYSREEVAGYLGYCEDFLKKGRVLHDRINTDTMFDYVHPRSHDHVNRTHRIYQFFHNHQSGLVADFLGKAIALRDEIESVWLADEVYRSEKEKLQNYTIVTSYNGNHGLLPRHRDYNGPARSPLIQFWVLLSEPQVDYLDGNLVLYTASGRCIRLEKDFDLKPGDAIIFDKHLEHEVEQTKDAGAAARGRWTVLIGARADRDKPILALYKRIRHSDLVHQIIRMIKK